MFFLYIRMNVRIYPFIYFIFSLVSGLKEARNVGLGIFTGFSATVTTGAGFLFPYCATDKATTYSAYLYST